jgi:hypothetical protein
VQEVLKIAAGKLRAGNSRRNSRYALLRSAAFEHAEKFVPLRSAAYQHARGVRTYLEKN